MDKSSSASLLISVIHFSIFFRGRLPLPRKRPHIEKYYPFPRYKIKPTNGSEYTKFHFDCHIICLPLQNRCRLQCLVNSWWEIKKSCNKCKTWVVACYISSSYTDCSFHFWHHSVILLVVTPLPPPKKNAS